MAQIDQSENPGKAFPTDVIAVMILMGPNSRCGGWLSVWDVWIVVSVSGVNVLSKRNHILCLTCQKDSLT